MDVFIRDVKGVQATPPRVKLGSVGGIEETGESVVHQVVFTVSQIPRESRTRAPVKVGVVRLSTASSEMS
jgi:hypothetical protein